MQGALVSIIMPAFNNAPFIEAAIDSVRVQTHKNWELDLYKDMQGQGGTGKRTLVNESKCIIQSFDQLLMRSGKKLIVLLLF